MLEPFDIHEKFPNRNQNNKRKQPGNQQGNQRPNQNQQQNKQMKAGPGQTPNQQNQVKKANQNAAKNNANTPNRGGPNNNAAKNNAKQIPIMNQQAKNQGGNQQRGQQQPAHNNQQRHQQHQLPRAPMPRTSGQNGQGGHHSEAPQPRMWKNNLPLMGASTYELPLDSVNEKKFSGRCRLFVGNLPPNMTDEQLREMFSPYGETSEIFLGKGNNFAFVKMDTRRNAEEARAALDLSIYENRTIRVRLAAHGAAIKVTNLTPMVTNELLRHSFSLFGEVERAVVITDDRGRSTGEGIVEFARKGSANAAMQNCQRDNFLLTAIPQPVLVEAHDQKDDEVGYSDKVLNKNLHEFNVEREVGPRFTEPGTFEHEFATRWKQLFEIEKQKRERLEIEIQEARSKLREQMEIAKTEHQAKVLREKLKEMEERTGKFQQRNLEDERRREEERLRHEAYLRQREEEILRCQGNYRNDTELMQDASMMQDLLDQQEAQMRKMEVGNGRSYNDPYGQAPPIPAPFAVSSGHHSPMEHSRYPPPPGSWPAPPPLGHPIPYGGPGLPVGHPMASNPAFGSQKRRRF